MRSLLATLALVAVLLTGCLGSAPTNPDGIEPGPLPGTTNPAPSLRPADQGIASVQSTPQPEPEPTPPPEPRPIRDLPLGPVPEPVHLNADGAPDLEPLRLHLQGYIGQQKGTYGVYVIDLISGRAIGVNENEIFRTASTFKLPMSMYVMNQAAAGKVSLDEKLTYQESDLEYGTGTLQDRIKAGDQYPLGQLVDLALMESDNIATNMITRRFGFQPIYAYMLELGGTVTKFDSESIGSTPKDMATYMHQLYRPTGANVATPELRQRLLNALLHTSFHDRTEAGVPDGVRVAHKIGTLVGVINDVALVYAPQRPFIIAVMSKDVREDVGPGVITELTKYTYQFLNPA